MLVFSKENTMATLYVQNVPAELYEALRRQAERNRKSIAAEVVSLLELNVPTREELKIRRDFLRQAQRLRLRKSSTAGPFPSSEEMQREGRSR
jgi:plasmid stability protein